MPTELAKEHILKHQKLFEILNEGTNNGRRPIVISDKEDWLLSHERGYGEGKKPEDYLEEFKTFISENMNKIATLNIVCTRPKELTRESLKSLRLELDMLWFKANFEVEKQRKCHLFETVFLASNIDDIGF